MLTVLVPRPHYGAAGTVTGTGYGVARDARVEVTTHA